MIYLITIVLILFSALFSGLTLGLMGLDVHELKRKMKFKNADAKKVYHVRKRGNLLLTTLLLGNVGVNAALSIFLGSIASGVIAGLIATGLIFLFGEIIPQAVISRHALKFGAKVAWIVQVLLVVLYPICGPIAWILDKLLGHELPSVYSRKELLSVIEEHEASTASDIDADEERIVKGALTFSKKSVSQILTPKTVAVMANNEKPLTKSVVRALVKSGHSRIPVFEESQDDIIGILHLKTLLGKDWVGKTPDKFMQKGVKLVQNTMLLDEVLGVFTASKQHLLVVNDEFGVVTGIVTIEDVLEEILGEEILDEFDKEVDLRKAAKRKKAKKK